MHQPKAFDQLRRDGQHHRRRIKSIGSVQLPSPSHQLAAFGPVALCAAPSTCSIPSHATARLSSKLRLLRATGACESPPPATPCPLPRRDSWARRLRDTALARQLSFLKDGAAERVVRGRASKAVERAYGRAAAPAGARRRGPRAVGRGRSPSPPA
jgi:hypothetical protein